MSYESVLWSEGALSYFFPPLLTFRALNTFFILDLYTGDPSVV